jgi:tRNA threonylcarbamoyladenosine biosynthesis protein TsaE
VAIQPIVKNVVWADESATQACAERLAACPGIAHAVIELHGDLGAGKTTWVRHLLRALGVQGRIKSPTYGVVEPHQGIWRDQAVQVWHFDFYRLEDPREWIEAGLRDLFAQTGLKLVEWPEKAGPGRPAADLAIHIECANDEQRRVCVKAVGLTGQQLLEAF